MLIKNTWPVSTSLGSNPIIDIVDVSGTLLGIKICWIRKQILPDQPVIKLPDYFKYTNFYEVVDFDFL